MAETTLCQSCNAPAPEYDRFNDLVHELLSAIAAGVDILRVHNRSTRRDLPPGTTEWKVRANRDIHSGNDFRDELNQSKSIHRDCDTWKTVTRRVRKLLEDLAFVQDLVRGIS